MLRAPGAITRDSPVCQAVPVVLEKFVVDFANGIDVARDHLHVQRARSGFACRLWDGVTGKGSHRQNEINARLLDSAQGSLRWLVELTRSLSESYLAIARVNGAVSRLGDDVSTLASVSADTRKALADLGDVVTGRLAEFDQWAKRKDAYDDAMRQQDLVFAKWARGGYDGISLAGRCYAALEELRWGRFGAYATAYAGQVRLEMFQLVKDRAMRQMLVDAALKSVDERMPTASWLTAPTTPLADATEALAFLADDHAAAPFARAVSAGPAERRTSDDVPLISSAKRIAETLTWEVLGG